VALLSRTRNRVIAGAVVGTSVVLVAVAAFAGLGLHRRPAHSDPPLAAASASDPTSSSPSASASTPDGLDEPTESPTASPTPSPTRRASPTPAVKKKSPPPSAKPVQVVKPPPPRSGGRPPGPSSPSPGANCPKLTGPAAPRADVAAAMSAAANHSYRPTLSLTDNPPAITVRLLLIQGIGWEESGWQSTIVSCDDGVGTMQVMKDTATWMNEKYGTNHDRYTLTGNVSIATGYLAWLTRYFGDRYFNGNYSLAGDPVKIVLLDMVISAYQAGYGTVENAINAGQDLPNRWYVDTVEGFMTGRPWEAS
jgi:soluble lytic murein transglycosylase-like protein